MNIIIIGGGASGLFSALRLATFSKQNSSGSESKDIKITVLEKNKNFGKKLSITGNGKCNFTNLNFEKEYFHSNDADKAWGILNTFKPEQVIEAFNSIGIETFIKDGYVYPACRSASEFTNILIHALEKLPVKLKTNQNVLSVRKANNNSFLVDVEGYSYPADIVIVSTGGVAAPETGSDGSGIDIAKAFGHNIVPLKPALAGLVSKDPIIAPLTGLRIIAKATLTDNNNPCLIKASDFGEIQFTKNGVSGIPVMNLSRFYTEGDELHLDICPDMTEDELTQKLCMRLITLGNAKSFNFLDGFVSHTLGEYLLKSLFDSSSFSDNILNEQDMYFLSKRLKNICISTQTVKNYQEAQVTCGGVDLSELTDNLESTLVPHLYFAGEVTDVDGRCGGYNLQWAFASAAIVAKDIINKLL